jgi:DNA-directed RNA polymerase subunit beta'
MFEARNPSNPAVVSEVDGSVSFGKIKRGNREVIITTKTGETKKYLIKLAKHILVQENDYVKAGMPLCDGVITPADILAIKGVFEEILTLRIICLTKTSKCLSLIITPCKRYTS